MAPAIDKTAVSKQAASKATKKAGKTATKKSASKQSTSKAAGKKSASKASGKQLSGKASGKKSSSKQSANKTAAKKSSSKQSTSKTAAKKSTARAAGKNATGKKAASKRSVGKAAGKKSASKRSTSERTARAESAEQRGARAAAAALRVISWLQRHASLRELPAGASPAALAAVEAALGAPLPPGLRAWWSLHDGGVPIFEYAGMSCAESLRRRKGLETLRRGGTFDGHELFEQDEPRIAPVKWHTGWIPLAEDGCGNLYLVDTAPGPAGQVGQVLRWEVRGGAFAASSVLLADVLERYADALASGKFVFDPQSLNFDGPFLDLLAPRRSR